MKSFNAIEHFHKKKLKLSCQNKENTFYLVYDIDDDLSATLSPSTIYMNHCQGHDRCSKFMMCVSDSRTKIETPIDIYTGTNIKENMYLLMLARVNPNFMRVSE